MDFIFIFSIFALLVAFWALIKSADLLIVSSSVLGQRFGLSRFIIGLTIVAIGTSLPELFTSISGIYKSADTSSFVVGTILGSNISNILLIFGVLLFFSKKFKSSVSNFDISVFGFSTITLLSLIYLGNFSFLQGFIFLGFYLGYLYYDIHKKGKDKYKHTNEDEFTKEVESYSIIKIFLLLGLSLLGLNFSSQGVVFNIEYIGTILGIPLSYLTLTTVALATSLPEAIVTYSSAKNEEYDLAIGNIIGSNISNVFFIGGVVGLLKQFNFDSSTFFISSVFLVLATLLFSLVLKKSNVKRSYGFFVLFLYVIYICGVFLY